MGQSHIHEFIRGLPKCEHHVHLEGCLTPELIFQLAKKNNIQLPSPEADPSYESEQTLAERYKRFTSLDDFLAFYFRGMDVLVGESDFEDLAFSYFQQAKADGVHHAEVFFDPQVHEDRGIPYDTIVEGFSTGCKRAEKELGLSTRLILCFVRHLSVDSARHVYEEAIDRKHFESDTIHGIGWSSTEVGPPKDMYRDLYASAKSKGIHLTAHAGEEGDASYISTALELGATRIDHGIHLIEDPVLMERVAKAGILFTLCPLSNVELRCVKSIDEVPIRKFLDAGVKFSINCDDPAYFGGYILDNYLAVEDAFHLSVDDWRTIARNGVTGSWIDEAREKELLAKIDEHVSKYRALL